VQWREAERGKERMRGRSLIPFVKPLIDEVENVVEPGPKLISDAQVSSNWQTPKIK
jgi:hypothetical protein